MKHKKLVVLITAIILLLSSIGIYGKTLFLSPVKGEVSTILSFNFDGIDEGLNPHGGTFDIQQFKNENVLTKTIADLKLEEQGITKEILGQHIQLKAYVPQDVLDRILPKASGSGVAQTQDIDGKTYHPTQYRVTLKRTKELGLNKKEAIQVLEKLIENYTQDFIDRYKDTQALASAITKIDPERYDYSEYILLAEGQLEIMHKYLLAKEQQAGSFRAESTGMTFSDLIAQVELLRDIEISNVNALVDTFVITNNQKELQSVYENRLTSLKREKEQLGKQKEAVAAALRDYQKDPTVILENGTVVSEAYVSEEKELPLYDDLMQKSIDLEAKFNNVNYQIRYYEDLLSKIHNSGQGGTVPTAYVEEVKNTINYISTRIDELVKLTTETADEYYMKDAFEKSVTRTAPIVYSSAFKLGFIKNTVVVGLITMFGLVLGIIGALGKELHEGKKEVSTK